MIDKFKYWQKVPVPCLRSKQILNKKFLFSAGKKNIQVGRPSLLLHHVWIYNYTVTRSLSAKNSLQGYKLHKNDLQNCFLTCQPHLFFTAGDSVSRGAKALCVPVTWLEPKAFPSSFSFRFLTTEVQNPTPALTHFIFPWRWTSSYL